MPEAPCTNGGIPGGYMYLERIRSGIMPFLFLYNSIYRDNYSHASRFHTFRTAQRTCDSLHPIAMRLRSKCNDFDGFSPSTPIDPSRFGLFIPLPSESTPAIRSQMTGVVFKKSPPSFHSDRFRHSPQDAVRFPVAPIRPLPRRLSSGFAFPRFARPAGR